jgi:hypothetical protein
MVGKTSSVTSKGLESETLREPPWTTKSLKGTALHMAYEARKLRAMIASPIIKQQGSFRWFVTFAPADRYDIRKLCGASTTASRNCRNGGGVPRSALEASLRRPAPLAKTDLYWKLWEHMCPLECPLGVHPVRMVWNFLWLLAAGASLTRLPKSLS